MPLPEVIHNEHVMLLNILQGVKVDRYIALISHTHILWCLKRGV